MSRIISLKQAMDKLFYDNKKNKEDISNINQNLTTIENSVFGSNYIDIAEYITESDGNNVNKTKPFAPSENGFIFMRFSNCSASEWIGISTDEVRNIMIMQGFPSSGSTQNISINMPLKKGVKYYLNAYTSNKGLSGKTFICYISYN